MTSRATARAEPRPTAPRILRFGFRCLRSIEHLRLFEPDQQPGLDLVRAKVHEATGNILSKVLQARSASQSLEQDLGVFSYPRKKVQSRISSRLENDPLPLLSVFIDNMHVDEVQIDGGGTKQTINVIRSRLQNRQATIQRRKVLR